MQISKKAINFDLDNKLLQKYYPSKSYKNGWKDIYYFLLKSNFQHRQYSGYVSTREITMTEVNVIIRNMSLRYVWLKKCVKQFDVTIVGEEYSFIDTIINASYVDQNEYAR